MLLSILTSHNESPYERKIPPKSDQSQVDQRIANHERVQRIDIFFLLFF